MTRQEIQQAGIDRIYAAQGKAAQFVPSSGTGCPCILLTDESKSAVELCMMADAETAVVRVRKSEVPSPSVLKDAFTIGSETWIVGKVIEGLLDPFELVLVLQKDV